MTSLLDLVRERKAALERSADRGRPTAGQRYRPRSLVQLASPWFRLLPRFEAPAFLP
jgi:hypothetical protein